MAAGALRAQILKSTWTPAGAPAKGIALPKPTVAKGAPLAGTPVTPTAATPVKGTPLAQAPAALPVDPAYDQQIAGLQRAQGLTESGLQGERARGLLSYGYNATYDPSGNVSGVSIDTSNPYSRAALLQRHHDQQQASLTNSYAARGQLYSGALQNAKDQEQFGYGQSQNALQSALIGFLASNQSARLKAGSDYELGAAGASSARLGRVLSNPLYNPANAGTPTGSAASAPAAAPTASGVKFAPGVSLNPRWELYRDAAGQLKARRRT